LTIEKVILSFEKFKEKKRQLNSERNCILPSSSRKCSLQKKSQLWSTFRDFLEYSVLGVNILVIFAIQKSFSKQYR
jgi:hypothetical protein